MGFLIFAFRMILLQRKANGRKAWRNLKLALKDGKVSVAEWNQIGTDLRLLG